MLLKVVFKTYISYAQNSRS